MGCSLKNKYCQEKVLQKLEGEVLADNTAMLNLAHSLGFEHQYTTDAEMIKVRLQLRKAGA